MVTARPATATAPGPPRSRTARGAQRVKVASDAPALYEVHPKLATAVEAVGNNTVADLLGVSPSQPGRWVRREEGISPDNQAAIIGLDFVLSLLLRAMSPDLAALWLVSPNAHLNGARPVDAFRLAGHRPVVEAIAAYAEGAYA